MKTPTIFLLLISSFCLLLASYKTYTAITHPIKYENEIACYAEKYSLSPSLVASIINVESSYKKNAKSSKNAIGLMQIKLSTANYVASLYNMPTLTEDELFKPKTNIEYGCMYLNYLSKKFSDTNTMLASYNAGETVVRSWLNNEEYSLNKKSLKLIPYEETKNYVKKENKNIKYYEKIY